MKSYLNTISSGYRQVLDHLTAFGYQVGPKDSADGVTLEVRDPVCFRRVARVIFHPSFAFVTIGNSVETIRKSARGSKFAADELDRLRPLLAAQRDIERGLALDASDLAYYDGVPHEAQDAR